MTTSHWLLICIGVAALLTGRPIFTPDRVTCRGMTPDCVHLRD